MRNRWSSEELSKAWTLKVADTVAGSGRNIRLPTESHMFDPRKNTQHTEKKTQAQLKRLQRCHAAIITELQVKGERITMDILVTKSRGSAVVGMLKKQCDESGRTALNSLGEELQMSCYH